MDVWVLLIVGFALWFGFQWGKNSSRDKEANELKHGISLMTFCEGFFLEVSNPNGSPTYSPISVRV